MKKHYEKPQILFESFVLSTNINAGCEVPTNLPNWNECGLNFSGVVVFMQGMQGCTDIQIPEGDHFEGICYHTPTEDNNIFAS